MEWWFGGFPSPSPRINATFDKPKSALISEKSIDKLADKHIYRSIRRRWQWEIWTKDTRVVVLRPSISKHLTNVIVMGKPWG